MSIAPAGDVNATVAAYGRFVQLHLRGLRGRPELIGVESFNRLHSPVGGAFALGWGIQPWEGARTGVHLGSAGTFYALVAVQPERDLAVAVLTNPEAIVPKQRLSHWLVISSDRNWTSATAATFIGVLVCNPADDQ